MQETWVWPLGWEIPWRRAWLIHSSILAWRSPWTEKPGGLQSTGLQRAINTLTEGGCIRASVGGYGKFYGAFWCWGYGPSALATEFTGNFPWRKWLKAAVFWGGRWSLSKISFCIFSSWIVFWGAKYNLGTKGTSLVVQRLRLLPLQGCG